VPISIVNQADRLNEECPPGLLPLLSVGHFINSNMKRVVKIDKSNIGGIENETN